ncbi:MAG: hypothetical protein J3K34DRAFT_429658 [Monoraphidium minutum]|nr:MAG: hypothetical protein J3K34DRAFT_429658 [Monoraphidium minutum]
MPAARSFNRASPAGRHARGAAASSVRSLKVVEPAAGFQSPTALLCALSSFHFLSQRPFPIHQGCTHPHTPAPHKPHARHPQQGCSSTQRSMGRAPPRTIPTQQHAPLHRALPQSCGIPPGFAPAPLRPAAGAANTVTAALLSRRRSIRSAAGMGCGWRLCNCMHT